MTTRTGLVLATLLAVLVAPAWAGDGEDVEPPKNEDTIEFTTSYTGASSDDAEHRVAEYDLVESNPILGLAWFTSPYDANLFSLVFERKSDAFFHGEAAIDLDRKVRVTASADGLLHRLDHDPLANLQAVSDVKVVRSTDFEPGVDYQIRRRRYEVDAEFQHPDVAGFVWRAGYAREERDGTRQHLSTSHCTSCHTTSQGREIDRTTTDVTLGAHLRTGKFDLDYALLSRAFVEDGLTPSAPYERAYHPGFPAGPSAGLQTPFNDRLWFQNGSVPVDAVPEIKKTSHRLQAKATLGTSRFLDFTLVSAETENRGTDLAYEFTGYRGRYSTRLGQRGKLNVSAAFDEIENDSVFIDLLALNGLASPPITNYPGGFPAGITFEEWRRLLTGDATLNFTDYTRNSAMDRSIARLRADGSWRLARRGTLRVGYRYESVDRDNVVLTDGDGETTTQTIKVGWNQRYRKRLRWHNLLEYKTVDNPYVNVDGGLRLFAGYLDEPTGIVVGNAASPKAPTSLQYYELHELRAADLGLAPSTRTKFRSSGTWSKKGGKLSVTGNLRYQDAENDDLDYTDWSQDTLGIGANVFVASGPRFLFNVGVDHFVQETDAEAIIPLMDG
jgi:hypothetical protein